MTASTFPGPPEDGTPGFVRDLALAQSEHFDTLVLVPRVPRAPAVERHGAMTVRRFRYFPRRWEDLAHGAIIENLRAQRSRYLQVIPFVVAEAIATLRAVRGGRPDVAHVHWIIPQGVVATLVAPRIPRVITTLGGDLYALDSAPLRALKSWVLRKAGAVTVMNNEMRDVVLALGARPESIHVMPMGVDLAAVRAAGPVNHQPTYGVTRLLFVGRLVEKKGLAVLLGAIRSQAGQVELTVVGDGPLRPGLEAAAEGLMVTFLGQLGRSDLMAEYRRADVVVVPSIRASSGDQDGLPVALLEAMASGCAVVASDLPGINEVIVPGESGLLVPPGDVAALARAIAVLSAAPERRQGMGRAAAERAEDFSVDRVAERYVTLLRSVVRAAQALNAST